VCTLFYEKNRDHYGIAFERYSRTNVITCVIKNHDRNPTSWRGKAGVGWHEQQNENYFQTSKPAISRIYTLKPSSPLDYMTVDWYATNSRPIFYRQWTDILLTIAWHSPYPSIDGHTDHVSTDISVYVLVNLQLSVDQNVNRYVGQYTGCAFQSCSKLFVLYVLLNWSTVALPVLLHSLF